MESYISFSIISVFFYTFMILTLLAGKRSRIINSFMCVLGGMLCWTLGSFLMRMEAGPSYILWYYVSLAGILFLPYFYYVFISEFMGVRILLFVDGLARPVRHADLRHPATGVAVFCY